MSGAQQNGSMTEVTYERQPLYIQLEDRFIVPRFSLCWSATVSGTI